MTLRKSLTVKTMPTKIKQVSEDDRRRAEKYGLKICGNEYGGYLIFDAETSAMLTVVDFAKSTRDLTADEISAWLDEYESRF